ncbi:recombinase family protein [Vagococcus sp. BWB3-3]|uniref:Recombinase family protein n=1 Tax=Vagococcus allomyrinae TaxID=2794353 RepID=A0A940SXR8_9ENTE|nr:recombinase family protein [Vagococcus allomyrinae]MBP1043601.1 recombinase family protein [Vagococcus allomyrinae]
MTTVGYMRVSTHQQKFDSQLAALENYGVDQLFKEYESGRNTSRTELNKALASLSPGDTFVIFKLDRLARTTKQLLVLLERFDKQNIQFVSIQNNIDTSTAMGRFFFTVMGAFAEMEAELIRERVMAGLDAAKENGVQLGRPPEKSKVGKAIDLYQTTDLPIAEISKTCDVSIPNLYYHLKQGNLPLRRQKN